MGNTTVPTPEEAARILAAVARETRSYTDPRAEYPLAEKAREARLAGALRRRARRREEERHAERPEED